MERNFSVQELLNEPYKTYSFTKPPLVVFGTWKNKRE